MPIRSRMKPRLLIPLLILWGLTACEQPTDNTATLGSLAGEVRDRNSGSLIGKALVQAVGNGVADTTEHRDMFEWDTPGIFSLDSLSTGLDTIIVSRELYYTQEYLVDIAPGANEIDFYLDPLCPYDTLLTQYQYSKMYIRILGQWYLIDHDDHKWEVENTGIVVKFKDNVSQEEIEAFNATMGVQVIRTNITGSFDCRVPYGADPMCIILAYYGSGLIEYAYPNTYGILWHIALKHISDHLLCLC